MKVGDLMRTVGLAFNRPEKSLLKQFRNERKTYGDDLRNKQG